MDGGMPGAGERVKSPLRSPLSAPRGATAARPLTPRSRSRHASVPHTTPGVVRTSARTPPH
eukprot:6681066-Prymnesium_polylepis.1